MNDILTNVWWTVAISGGILLLFSYFQLRYFTETYSFLDLYKNFFTKLSDYKTEEKEIDGDTIPQLVEVGIESYDLNNIIAEINHYIVKTRGTTDFAVIQNKVECNLTMRYDQAMSKLSFPTNIGLMGTFLGVFLGIAMFVLGFNGSDALRDSSIRNLLIGVLISMSTSFIGLLLTTINTGRIGEAQKDVESDKNEFYDFIQTELMPSLDVSLVTAISKLHETVDKFEPAFDGVITRFQNTFDRCTQAFGQSFETNVKTVSNAVRVMGENMDKINENIALQKSVLSTFKSEEVVRGLEKYVEAADHFVGITQSLNKFEEARRMMLAAAQEAINLQNAYSESLVVPREVALRINQILDRVKNFEANIERLGDKLNEREILGNDVVNAIRDQVNAIEKKSKIADSYLEVADGNLEDLFQEQTKAIEELNKRYRLAIAEHADEFEKLIDDLKEDIRVRHYEFLALMEDNLNVEMIHKDFSNLSKLDQLSSIRDDLESIFDYLESTNKILGTIEFHHRQQDNSGDSHKKKEIPAYVPAPPVNDEEMKQIRKENQELRNNIQILTNGVSELINEIKKKEETYSRIPVSSRPQYKTYSAPRIVDSQQSFTSPAKPVDEEQNSHISPVVDQSSSDKKIVKDTNIEETVETAEEEPVEEKKKRWWWPFNK
ncbi:MAG: hypothetical protein E7107_06845 [Prevotella sp.]|nr:hypothetical protein [Prevotella sp.]